MSVKLRKLNERFDIENRIVRFAETHNGYDTIRSAVTSLIEKSVSSSLLEEEETRG